MEMAILSRVCEPGDFESHNSSILSFINIRALHLNFEGWQSFLEATSPEILAVCETNLDNSIYSGSFPVRGYLPLI